MKKKYAQKYAQIQKQIRFLPLLLIALLVLSGVFGTWYVKADDANDPEWRLEAELLSDAGAVIGNEEAYAGKVIIRLRIFLSDERNKKENDLDKGGAEADGNIEETERSKETEEPVDRCARPHAFPPFGIYSGRKTKSIYACSKNGPRFFLFKGRILLYNKFEPWKGGGLRCG